MGKIMRSIMTHRAWIWIPGILGDVFLIVGIVAAVINATFAGFTPTIWVLLAIAFYLYMICVVTLQILGRMESKT